MKYALIIGNESYSDPKLAQLKTPAADSRALANVLDDEKIGGFDEVTPLINQTETEIRRTIGSFLEGKKPDDLVLVYFSGHGVLDSNGRLFLASIDTQINILRSSAIPSAFITDEMDNCRSKRQILILDCCHSGAFARGTKAGAQKAVTATTFEGNGYGRVVLTSSDSTQYALEGDQVIKQTELSLFTHFLLEGLHTGKADMNNDGHISLDEWYDYTYTQVLSTTPKQVPLKWSYRTQGDLIIAKNPRYELMQSEISEEIVRQEAEERVRQERKRRARETLEFEKAVSGRLERENAGESKRPSKVFLLGIFFMILTLISANYIISPFLSKMSAASTPPLVPITTPSITRRPPTASPALLMNFIAIIRQPSACYAGPSENHQSSSIISANKQVSVLGRNSDGGDWFMVQGDNIGRCWIYGSDLQYTFDPSLLSDIPAAVTTVDATCRSGPSTLNAANTYITQGSRILVVGKNYAADWVLVTPHDSFIPCWIAVNLLAPVGLSSIPIVTIPTLRIIVTP